MFPVDHCCITLPCCCERDGDLTGIALNKDRVKTKEVHLKTEEMLATFKRKLQSVFSCHIEDSLFGETLSNQENSSHPSGKATLYNVKLSEIPEFGGGFIIHVLMNIAMFAFLPWL